MVAEGDGVGGFRGVRGRGAVLGGGVAHAKLLYRIAGEQETLLEVFDDGGGNGFEEDGGGKVGAALAGDGVSARGHEETSLMD